MAFVLCEWQPFYSRNRNPNAGRCFIRTFYLVEIVYLQKHLKYSCDYFKSQILWNGPFDFDFVVNIKATLSSAAMLD